MKYLIGILCLISAAHAQVANSVQPVITGTGAVNNIGKAFADSVYIKIQRQNVSKGILDSIKIKVSIKDTALYKRSVIFYNFK